MRRGAEEGIIALVVILVLIGYALMYVAIAAGICLALFGIFLLFRWLLIGWTKKSKADPLFTKAARSAVKNKGFDRVGFAQKHSISDARSKFITRQLRLAGVMADSTVLIDKQWGLRLVFRSINSENEFFLSRIQDDIESILSSIAEQTRSESDVYILSILSSIKTSAETGMKLSYYKLWQKAIQDYADQSEIDSLSGLIDDLSSQNSVNDFLVGYDVMQDFNDFCSYFTNKNSTKAWNTNHQIIDISQDSFCDIHINGKPQEVPYIAGINVEAFFYPTFVVVLRKQSQTEAFRIIDYSSLRLITHSFTEPESNWFTEDDASVAYRTWLHSKVNGGPDLRYKNNPSTAHYSFYKACLSPLGIEIISGSSSFISRLRSAFSFLCKAKGSINKSEPLRGELPKAQKQDSTYCSSELGQRITKAIKQYSISEEAIDNGTLISALNDYQVFRSIEDRSYAIILRQAIREGVLSTVMRKGPSSVEGANAIKTFILTSGFDEKRTETVIEAIYHGFRS